MWNFNDESLHQHSPRNYMAGDAVFIQDELDSNNSAFLIADMYNFIFNPLNAEKDLNIFINTCGGEVWVMNQIIGLINLAKLRNIRINTFVLGIAASAGSIIAIHGDNRVMARNAIHMVHFGSIFEVITKHSEIEKAYTYNMEYSERIRKLYLEKCPGLTAKKLTQLEEDEKGRLFADECLKLGLCDMIVDDELDKKILEDKEQQEIYDKVLKQKEKIKKGA